jgi:hypothetical protein
MRSRGESAGKPSISLVSAVRVPTHNIRLITMSELVKSSSYRIAPKPDNVTGFIDFG